MKNWINENPGSAWTIAGAALGFLYIFLSTRWPGPTLIVVGLAALPHAYALFFSSVDRDVLPDWLIFLTAIILGAFASGSVILALQKVLA